MDITTNNFGVDKIAKKTVVPYRKHCHIGSVGNVPTHTTSRNEVATHRVSILSKNSKTKCKILVKSRTGISKAYDFLEQVKLIPNAFLLVKNNDPMHIFDRDFSRIDMSFSKDFPEKGSKKFPQVSKFSHCTLKNTLQSTCQHTRLFFAKYLSW